MTGLLALASHLKHCQLDSQQDKSLFAITQFLSQKEWCFGSRDSKVLHLRGIHALQESEPNSTLGPEFSFWCQKVSYYALVGI